MIGKLNNNNVTRLIYESYKGHLNEEDGGAVQYKNLLDLSPKIVNGKMYLYINISDPKMFGVLKDLASGLIKNAAESEEANLGRKLTPQETQKIMELYGTKSEKDDKGNIESEWVRILICDVNLMSEIYDEEGNVADSDAYRTVVKRLMSILKKLEVYNFNVSDDQVKNMFQTIFYHAKNMPSKEKIAEIKNDTDELFFQLCNTLGEEKTKELLNTIQVTDEDVVHDHQISFNNKLHIISQAIRYDQNGGNQLNTISYFATQRQWAKLGRNVVDFKHPYHIDVFHGGRGNIPAEDAELKNMGKIEGSGKRAGWSKNRKTNAAVYGRYDFGFHTYYDVSATETVDGVEDKFTTEPGMINNLTGELNSKAKDEIDRMVMNKEVGTKDDRTEQLNQLFGTNDYSKVDLIYNATCSALGHRPIVDQSNDVKNKIKLTGDMIEDELQKWAKNPRGGGIVKVDNYMPLVRIGTIIIQKIINLPMDNIKGVPLSDEYKTMAISMRSEINRISKAILDAERQIMSNKNKSVGMNEMIEIYSHLFVFEETFNNTLNILLENATKI